MTYTSVFGGNTIYPSDVSYLSLALSVDTPLEWPLESSGTEDPAARIIDVDPSADGFSIILPDATLTGAGQTILFNNIDGAYSFYVKDHVGNNLATVTAGTQWQVYLAATNTVAGTWRVFRYGASTATVQPSALAGFGLTATGATLSQSLPVVTFSTTGQTVATSNRASAFVWNAAGAGTLNLLTAASAGNNFFVFVRNEGGGDLTIEPAGSETINSAVNLVLRPGDSATLITDGATWYTIGLGQDAVFAFDYTIIDIPLGTSTLTLSGSQLNRVAYRFNSSTALDRDCTIVVPATVQQYWITNATTGPFRLFVKTSSGVPTQVNQGAKGIYYCDGTNMVLASDPTSLTTPVVISDGGTGSTTASGARLALGITTFADAIVTATAGATVRTTIGAAASGTNGDITSLTGLTTPLSITQGGTGGTTQGTARSGLGATTVGGNVFTLTNPNAVTFPRFNADNTVSAIDATALLTAIGAYPTSNPSGFTSNTGTVTSVATAGSTNGLSLTGGTFTTSGTITLSGSVTSVSANATINGEVIGYRNIPRSTTSITAATVDIGKVIAVSAGITIPNSTFAAGDAVSIYNDSAAAITITAGVTTLRLAGTTNTGNRTLAARGMATVWFNSPTEAIISGAGVS